MLGQSKNKFDKNANNQSLSVILKRSTPKHVNLIMDQPMEKSTTLQDSIIQDCCLFIPDQTGYYHISAQVCITNNSSSQSMCDFIQFGICDKQNMDSQCKEHMKSNICCAKIDPNYIMSDTISTIMHLQQGVTYTLWLNIGSDNASHFLYESENSNLRLYKL